MPAVSRSGRAQRGKILGAFIVEGELHGKESAKWME